MQTLVVVLEVTVHVCFCSSMLLSCWHRDCRCYSL